MNNPRIRVWRLHSVKDRQPHADAGGVAAPSYEAVKRLFPWAAAVTRNPHWFTVFPSLADYQLWRREQRETKPTRCREGEANMKTKFFDSSDVVWNRKQAIAYAHALGICEIAVSDGGTYAVADPLEINEYCAATGQSREWLIEIL